jgi:hypothetical protein
MGEVREPELIVGGAPIESSFVRRMTQRLGIDPETWLVVDETSVMSGAACDTVISCFLLRSGE